MDRLTRKRRSWNMSRIRSRRTIPELKVKQAFENRRFNCVANDSSLPGCPDLVFRRYKRVVFVHGCFWHQHPGCGKAYRPKSRREFWDPKLDANVRRDKRNATKLRSMGWRVSTIWECQTEKKSALDRRLRAVVQLLRTARASSRRRPA